MTHERGIVRPVRSARSPILGPLAIMAATETDLRSLRRRMELPNSRPLFMSRLCYDARRPASPCLAGPVTGSPYAAMLLETLRAWGVARVIFLGWCGAIHETLRAGDVVIPATAIVDEGTSLHYQQLRGAKIESDAGLTAALCHTFQNNNLYFHQGTVWTTDAIFRETPGKLKQFRDQGALAVEMELSALFSVARFYDMPAAAVLVVSDELATLQWRPGFRDAAFKQSRAAVCDLLSDSYGDIGPDGH